MIDERDMAFVLNAAGATLKAEMLDGVWSSIDRKAGAANTQRSTRIVSHSLQTLMYEREGYSFREVGGKRLTHIGVEWKTDDKLPLDCILVETEAGTALLKNLYPTCPSCLEWRVEQNLRAAGLLNRPAFSPIEVKDKPVSETIIEGRG